METESPSTPIEGLLDCNWLRENWAPGLHSLDELPRYPDDAANTSPEK